MKTIQQIGAQTKAAKGDLQGLSKLQKKQLIEKIALAIQANTKQIVAANAIDMENAQKNGMSPAMQDRLLLNEQRVCAMADAARHVANLPDPVGEVLGGQALENGLQMKKVRVPLGVVAMIFEARPNVSLDAACLCLKTSNCVILKGGSAACNSNKAIVDTLRGVVEQLGYNPDMVSLVEDNSREATTALMKLNEYVDVLIPRGGASLISSVVQNATVPVIETGTGNCHIYVQESADFDMAVNICHNAKTSRPSVCNSAESILVDESIALTFLPLLAQKLNDPYVKILGCPQTVSILGDRAQLATEQDYYAEFLDFTVSIKIVKNYKEAISHIEQYSTHHSDCIVTTNLQAANAFTSLVDSAAVYVNASTRFTDGAQFGMGAEIGISTQKLHARGPMGLGELTTYKYIVMGSGQIRE